MKVNKIKINTKGDSFEEIYGVTPLEMNIISHMEPTTENTEQVHLASFINVMLNENGQLPTDIISAAFTNNPDFMPEVEVPITTNSAKIIKKFYKKVGHAGIVKIINAIKEHNKRVIV